MFEQLSFFDLITPQESRLTAQIRRGSGFEGGRVRIYCASCNLGVKELAEFMKEEYGIGGNSITFPEGQHGFADYGPAGMKLREFKSNYIEKHSWTQCAKEAKRLILSNQYLSEKEWQQVQQIRQSFGNLPVPHPRMAVIPA